MGRRYSTMLVAENRWLAQRYGTERGLVDFGRRALVPYPELLDEILDLISEDAAALECEAEVAHARTILERGTSAHAQLEAFRAARQGGASETEALCAVVDLLLRETRAGL